MIEQRILQIEITSAEAALENFARVWERAERAEPIAPCEAIGFESLADLLRTLTPTRWALIEGLKRGGPLPAAELTGSHALVPGVNRADLDALLELGIIELDEQQRAFIPWDEIDLRVPLAV